MHGSLGRTLGTALACAACAPALTRDGQWVFTPDPQHGGTILTARGVEYVDHNYVPKPAVRKSAFEPWSPPIQFLLPADGAWDRVAEPLSIEMPGMRVVLRTSDAFVPSWGGELLVRIDAWARPREPRSASRVARLPLALALVVADRGGVGAKIARAVLRRLESQDTMTMIDADGSQIVLPPLPCTHRTLAMAALRRRTMRHYPSIRRDLAWALGKSHELLSRVKGSRGATARVVVVVDANAPDTLAAKKIAVLERAGASVVALAAHDGVAAFHPGPRLATVAAGGVDAGGCLGHARSSGVPTHRRTWLTAVLPPGAAKSKEGFGPTSKGQMRRSQVHAPGKPLQVAQHLVRGLVAHLGIPIQGLEHDTFEIPRIVRADLARTREFAIADAPEGFGLGFALEQPPARRELEQQHADGEQVASPIELLARRLLRRHVSGFAFQHAGQDEPSYCAASSAVTGSATLGVVPAPTQLLILALKVSVTNKIREL